MGGSTNPEEQTMSDVSQSPETENPEEASIASSASSFRKKTIEDYENDLKVARLKLAQAKKRQLDQSVRNRGRRERDTGRTVLRMIEEGKLDSATIALIADEVRAYCRSPTQVAAFRGSVFE